MLHAKLGAKMIAVLSSPNLLCHFIVVQNAPFHLGIDKLPMILPTSHAVWGSLAMLSSSTTFRQARAGYQCWHYLLLRFATIYCKILQIIATCRNWDSSDCGSIPRHARTQWASRNPSILLASLTAHPQTLFSGLCLSRRKRHSEAADNRNDDFRVCSNNCKGVAL